MIYLIQLKGGGETPAILELTGDNLNGSLKVWFDDVEAETESRLSNNQDSLQCMVPDISNFYPPGSSWLTQPTQVKKTKNIEAEYQLLSTNPYFDLHRISFIN